MTDSVPTFDTVADITAAGYVLQRAQHVERRGDGKIEISDMGGPLGEVGYAFQLTAEHHGELRKTVYRSGELRYHCVTVRVREGADSWPHNVGGRGSDWRSIQALPREAFDRLLREARAAIDSAEAQGVAAREERRA